MSTARATYRANHSDLRGLSRYTKDRAAKLAEVCDSRKFWFGDRWVVPASPPAQAALRVLNGSMRTDPLACNAVLVGINMVDRKLVARVVLAALRAQRNTNRRAA